MLKKLFGFGKDKEKEIEKKDAEEEIEVEDSVDNLENLEETIFSGLEEEVIDKVEDIEEKTEESVNNEGTEEIENFEKIEVEMDSNGKEVENISNNDSQEEIIEELENYDEIESKEIEDKKVNLFERLKQGLTKAKQGITDRIDEVLKSYTKIDEELLEDLEEILITADVGVNTTMDIIERLRDKIKQKGITEPIKVREELKSIVEDILTNENSTLDIEPAPCIILMVGVNGVGKTTTIGKLANRYKKDGKKVLLAAADTFRAAATEQLEIWANRTNVDIIKHQEGADPGAVVFDAIKAAKLEKQMY
ncbi:SRP54-type, GTPase domain protein [Clostridioides difficile CD165]|nr:SRP54-type, GTPase domain protein [Clostridioides difficile CD165]